MCCETCLLSLFYPKTFEIIIYKKVGTDLGLNFTVKQSTTYCCF